MFEEFLEPGSCGVLTEDNASEKFSSIEVRFPNFALSQAPFIAPHEVWPKTKINLEPANLQANSKLPKISVLPKFQDLQTIFWEVLQLTTALSKKKF